MIYLATDNGLVVGERQHAGPSAWRIVRRGLEGRHVTSVIAREGVILAGTTDGIFRSDDDGQSWRETSTGLLHRHVRWMAFHPDISDDEFAGTEPAGIFNSKDGGESWQSAPEVTQLRNHHHWFLPYSPEAGCVRGFAFLGSRAYAAVEVGGVLRSDNGGDGWQLADGSDGNPDLEGPPEPLIYPDVHSISVHPSSPDLVFAPTGDGFYRSSDGGKAWKCLYDCYCRAVWVDPDDAAHMVLGTAEHVESQGRIEESHDGGASWCMASHGLEVPWRHHMVERFTQIDAEILAVLSNGQLLSAPLPSLEWQLIFPEVKEVRAVASVDHI